MRLPRLGRISEEGLRGWGKMAEGIFGRRITVPEDLEEDELSAQTGAAPLARKQTETTVRNVQMPETGPERATPNLMGLPPVGPLTMDPEMTEQGQAMQDLDTMKLGARPGMPPLSRLQRATREQAVASGFAPGTSVPYSEWQEWQTASQKAIDEQEKARVAAEATGAAWMGRVGKQVEGRLAEAEMTEAGKGARQTAELTSRERVAAARTEAASKIRAAMSSEKALDREQRKALFQQGQEMKRQQSELSAQRLEQEDRFEEARDIRAYAALQAQSDDRQFAAYMGSIPAMKMTPEEVTAERTQAKVAVKKTIAGAQAKRLPRGGRGEPVATARFPEQVTGDQQAKLQRLLELRRKAGR